MASPFDALNTALSSQVNNITAAINANLPVVLGVAALIVGSRTVWRFAKSFLSGR